MHPSDGNHICYTGEVGRLQAEFAKRGVKLLALSCNDVELHKG